MKLGEFVKEKRLDLGLSQAEFGTHVGVSYVTINNIENKNKCGLITMRKLSKSLEITTKELRAMMNDENNE